mgnify:FL=1
MSYFHFIFIGCVYRLLLSLRRNTQLTFLEIPFFENSVLSYIIELKRCIVATRPKAIIDNYETRYLKFKIINNPSIHTTQQIPTKSLRKGGRDLVVFPSQVPSNPGISRSKSSRHRSLD